MPKRKAKNEPIIRARKPESGVCGQNMLISSAGLQMENVVTGHRFGNLPVFRLNQVRRQRAYGRRKVAARRFRSGDESQRRSGTETS